MKRYIQSSVDASFDDDTMLEYTVQYLAQLKPAVEDMFKEFPNVRITKYDQSEPKYNTHFNGKRFVQGRTYIYFDYLNNDSSWLTVWYDELAYNISKDVSKLRTELTKYILRWDIHQMLYESDPNWFDTYIESFTTYDAGTQDRRAMCKLELYVKKTGKKFIVKHRCPVNDSILLSMLDDAKLQIDQYFETRQTKLNRRSDLRAQGKQLYVPQGAVIKMIEDEFGLLPSFSYRDTGKIQYMLYKLPFTNMRTHELDKDAGEEFKADFEAFLDDIEAKYGLQIDADLPLSGPVIRAAFTLHVYGGPDLIYDKVTKQWSIA